MINTVVGLAINCIYLDNKCERSLWLITIFQVNNVTSNLVKNDYLAIYLGRFVMELYLVDGLIFRYRFSIIPLSYEEQILLIQACGLQTELLKDSRESL